jgi:hypothetical protein
MFPPVIASTAFVVIFAATALTVLFFAFGGGPTGARAQLQTQTRIGRRVMSLVIAVVIVLFGVGIPLLLVEENKDNQSKASLGGVTLNDSQLKGRKLFAINCSTCHTLAASNAVGKVGPDLDLLRPPKGLLLDAMANGRARGQGQMPAELLDGPDARNVASYVAAVAGR